MCQNSDDEETQSTLYHRMKAIVKKDKKHEFKCLINSLSLIYKELTMIDIAFFDAGKCLASIFEGVGGESLISLYVSEEDNMPLHYAARGARPRITKVLLDKGFSADLRSDFDSPDVCLKNALPLNVSLDYARVFLHWESLHNLLSPVHQISTLCKLMRNHIKTIRILARNTQEIKHEFFKYLKQGKVFEVGALLAIASDLVMSSSSTTDGENGSIGFKNIMEMRQFLLSEMSRSLIGATNTQLMEIKKTLRLLEIFDRVGDKLVAHMPMWDIDPSNSGIRVAALIKDAAFDEEEEVEHYSNYDGGYFRESYTPLPNNYPTSPYNVGHRHYSTRNFSTQVHFPSWLEEGNSHVVVPLRLPTTLKGAAANCVLSKKRASFTGAFAKAIRHLRYR